MLARLRTALTAVVGTAVVTAALLAANRALAPMLIGGPGSTCPQPDCALGAGLWLLVGAVLAVLIALVAGLVLGAERALRRGVWITAWCAAAFLVLSVVIWILI